MVPEKIMFKNIPNENKWRRRNRKKAESIKSSPSVKNTWAALYKGRVGDSKSRIIWRTESSDGVIK